MIVRAIFLSFLTVIFAGSVSGQGIYLDPAPTDVTSPARLYIDISSSECDCPELQDADPETNPLYIWTWEPFEARADITVDGETFNVTNGMWGDSNDNLVLTQDPDDPDLWYFDFLGASPVQFYGAPAAQFYETGISFLLKEKNGAPAGEAEQKSPDLSIIPEPIGCFDKVCPFPSVFFQDEFFAITYDNNQETITTLQNLGPGEALVWFRYGVNGGPLQVLQDEALGVMEFDGEGIFSFTMIPDEFFGLEEGDILDEIQVFITKPPIQAPPFTAPITLVPGCPE